MRQAYFWVALLLRAAVAGADATLDADLRQEIVLRCHYDVGEFGVESIHLCVEEDNAALDALSAYPEPVTPVVSRCTRERERDGWARVKLCIDQDLAAQDALSRYSDEYKAVIDLCRGQVGEQGPAKIKACVDQRISAKAGTGKRDPR